MERSMTARIIDYDKRNWYSKFLGCSFLVISIRQETVLVKSNTDEGYQHPYDVHEFPKQAIILE
ncbi:MAG: hypothetical protein HXX16_17190 [Bacteroidales bacterium]|nr:hypothetical protein [Bacteroidales bacterium]